MAEEPIAGQTGLPRMGLLELTRPFPPDVVSSFEGVPPNVVRRLEPRFQGILRCPSR